MLRAIAGNTAGQNLASLGDELSQTSKFFIIYRFYFLHTKAANPFARTTYSITLQFGFLLII
jgi:hypothetical protein